MRLRADQIQLRSLAHKLIAIIQAVERTNLPESRKMPPYTRITQIDKHEVHFTQNSQRLTGLTIETVFFVCTGTHSSINLIIHYLHACSPSGLDTLRQYHIPLMYHDTHFRTAIPSP